MKKRRRIAPQPYRRIDRPDMIERVLMDARAELSQAIRTHGPMRSAHEGHSVILEELDELWDEIKKKRSERSDRALRIEAIQVAAMALRFVIDVLDATPTTPTRDR